MKYVWQTLTLLLLIALVGVIAFFLGKQTVGTNNANNQATVTSQSANTSQENNLNPTNTPVPTIQKTTVTAGGLLTFKKYSIEIPEGWKYNKTADANVDILTITKDTFKLEITQGGMGGAMCLYSGDPDSEGPSSRFASYKEITTATGNLLRKGVIVPQNSFGICEKTQYGWGQPTSFGAISYKVIDKDPVSENQMEEMLASLKQL